MKVLFVGFSPFAAHPVNPSETIVKDFAKGNSKGIVLPVSYKRAKEEFIKAYEKYYEGKAKENGNRKSYYIKQTERN